VTRVLAWDPGTTHATYAVVEERGGDLTLAAYDTVAADRVALLRVSEEWLHRRDFDTLVGVETLPPFVAAQARVASLFASARVAGVIEGLVFPAPVYHMPANAAAGKPSWRGYLTGSRVNGARGARLAERAGDDEVREALLLHYPHLRRVRTNAHHRDAIGLATVLALLARNPHSLALYRSPHGGSQ
jgi:hypothetical protein